MKRLLMVAILGLVLTGCSNTKELIFGNIHVFYFPKNDTNLCLITIGSPSCPYTQESIKLYYKDGLEIDLSSRDIIDTLQSRYGRDSIVVKDVSGKGEFFCHPAQPFKTTWPEGTISYHTSLMDIILNNEKAIGFAMYAYKGLTAIEVKGIRKNFPLTESDVKDLFGMPDKVLLYFSE